MEQFRSVYGTIKAYTAKESTSPLSIAFFGPAGSGKSFAAMEVAATACCVNKTKRLHFNLGEFEGPKDLVNAFHLIRNSTLAGYLTLVYFEGFDNDLLDRPLGWVSYLSSYISSGTFVDKDHTIQHIGRAVFLFGSEHAATFEEFEQRLQSLAIFGKSTTNYSDFISSIYDTVNIHGPDRCHPFDSMFPIRRAVMLRNMLEEIAPSLKVGNHFPIEDDILRGLLLVPKLRHGTRSLRSLLEMCRFSSRPTFDRMVLPPPSQLKLHINYDGFKECMDYQVI